MCWYFGISDNEREWRLWSLNWHSGILTLQDIFNHRASSSHWRNLLWNVKHQLLGADESPLHLLCAQRMCPKNPKSLAKFCLGKPISTSPAFPPLANSSTWSFDSVFIPMLQPSLPTWASAWNSVQTLVCAACSMGNAEDWDTTKDGLRKCPWLLWILAGPGRNPIMHFGNILVRSLTLVMTKIHLRCHYLSVITVSSKDTQ